MEGLLFQLQDQSNVIKKSMLLKSASLKKSSHVDALNNLNTDLTTLEGTMHGIRLYLETERKALDQADQLIKAMQSQEDRLHHIKENIPTQMPTAATKTTQPLKSSHQIPQESHEPTKKSKARKSSKSSRSAVEIVKMEYVKVDEFDDTPKYIRGRVSRDQVNEIIDMIFSTMQKKYKILSQNRSKLSDLDRQRCTVYKETESKETDGFQFVVENDFKELCNQKLDNSARTSFNILRHLGRMKEIRGGGVTRYIRI
eukprot:m.155151 g.155151  ORF g.155151 m.155151 type:complete len:256 (-) comp30926_c0_seq1:321-1088(-)